MLAYVLLCAQPNGEEKVFKKVSSFPEVKKVNLLFGSWDLIAQVELKDAAALNDFMLAKIRKMPEVTLTATMIVAK